MTQAQPEKAHKSLAAAINSGKCTGSELGLSAPSLDPSGKKRCLQRSQLAGKVTVNLELPV